MDLQNPIQVRSRAIPAGYRLMRVVARLWLRLFFPRLRVLNRERLEQPGPAILLNNHPQSLPVSLLLISALDRQVHCLLPSAGFRGFFRKMAARALGIRGFDFTAEEQDSWLNPCLSILANQGAIALFAGATLQNGLQRAPVPDFAARLAVEAVLQDVGHGPPTLYPVHWLLTMSRRGPAPLMCIDSPIKVQHFLPKVGEDLDEASLLLVEAIQNAMGANIFALAERDLEHFNKEVEGLSREHLRQQWSRRPNWKQRAEELQLSSFVRKWVAEMNRTDPARLVELRESLDAYGEARRKCSMGEFIAETAGPWQSSSTRVAATWFETVLGFPVAVYGLVNHLPAVIILSTCGLLKSSPKRDPKVEWLYRIFIVLSSYTAQVFFVNFWWGRAVAGYYTLTLPVSAAYLWRYRWLVRNRIHVLIRKALQPGRTTRVARDRDNILARLDFEIDHSARSSSAPNPPSPDFAE